MDYQGLYNEAIKTIVEEKEYSKKLLDLNNDLVSLNKTISNSNNSLMFENQRLREVSKHGAFIEYNNDPSSLKFVPLLSNIQEFVVSPQKPTKLMFTFKFSDFETWAMNLYNLMKNNKSEIKFINKEELN